MAKYEVPTTEGRKLRMTACIAAPRPQVLVELVSRYGNSMEGVTLEAGDVLDLYRGAAKVARAAFELFNEEALARKVEADARWKAALARNPWLTLSPEERKQRGFV